MFTPRRLLAAGFLFLLALASLAWGPGGLRVQAAPPTAPTVVALPGDFDQQLGCPGDWMPDCPNVRLNYDANDDVWQNVFTITASSPITYNYKAALNNSWTENYGLHAIPNGPNIPLPLTQTTAVKFYYDDKTHWITDNATSVIAVAAGSFQSELGCAGDWDPGCLRSWLQDIDGDGVYTFTTHALPPGTYEAKVALDESWNENYGVNCAPGGANIPFEVATNGEGVTFSYDSGTHCLIIAPEQVGSLNTAMAHWVTRDTIAWQVPCAPQDIYTLHYSPTAGLQLQPQGIIGGQTLSLTCDATGLGPPILARYPYLAGYAALKLSQQDVGLVPSILKDQVAIDAQAPTSTTLGLKPMPRAQSSTPSTPLTNTLVDATAMQIYGVLDDLYAPAATESLGLVWQGANPTLKLWAPTAQDVKLHLFADSTTPVSVTVPMSYNVTTGSWSAAGTPAWNGMYYLYEVRVFTRNASGGNRNQVVTNLVTDPYAVSLSTNSTRSQIVNLDDPRLKPAGWDGLVKPRLDAPEDIVVYETHIRDFSVNDSTVPAAHRGTYLAFTDYNSSGMQHLRALAQAGLTHVHLLPAFDIASVNEDKATWQAPSFPLLASYPPSSTVQATLVMSTAEVDPFNWGYDPYHFNTPEGSYATDPNGPARILQFRQMVQGLAANGLRVVMDVVYNHTTASGEDPRSVFDQVVPGYYHRLNALGEVETSTCCQNTAPEHLMMDKFIVDSTVLWAKYYKVDGFRFDLMGHHPLADIEHVRDALQALTPARDGVDGSKIYLYGEGWNFGEVANNARFVQASQLNLAGSGVGSFNDRIRDGVKGGGPFDPKPQQGFIDGLYYDSNGNNQCNGHTCSPAEEKARLLQYQDWIRLSLAGNLRDYTMVDRTGATITGAQLDYNGAPAGYTLDPQESINYDEAHDNETLFDAITYKAPLSTTTTADRARMQDLGLDVVALAQGVPFFQAAQDLLRSKSLDTNSYNSGDWFNRIDWTGHDNAFGSGIPPTAGGDAGLDTLLLGQTARIKPTPADILQTARHFQEMLAIRKSSRLFRLETGQDIKDKVRFDNTGPNQIPGLIVMSIDDTQGRPVNDRYRRVVVLINATPTQQSYTVSALTGLPFALHPIQAASFDPVVRSATFDASTGRFVVPARTTAVFVELITCPAEFTDVPAEYWAYGYIHWAACNNIVSGYADHTFRPDANATRAQIAKMAVLAAGLPLNTSGGPHFTDVPAGHPFYTFVESAYNAGLISGYSAAGGGLEFRPSAVVTRGQLAKIIVKAAGLPLVHPSTATFQDVPPSYWAFSYIETAYTHNIIGGYDLPGGGREFRPGANATRAQLSKMLFQAVVVPSRMDQPAGLRPPAPPPARRP